MGLQLTDLGIDEMTSVRDTLLGRSAPIDLWPSSCARALLSACGRLPTSAGTLGAGAATAAALHDSACLLCRLKQGELCSGNSLSSDAADTLNEDPTAPRYSYAPCMMLLHSGPTRSEFIATSVI